MKFSLNRTIVGTAASAVVVAAMLPFTAYADSSDGWHSRDRGLTIYFTRHAEKETVTVSISDPADIYTTNDAGEPVLVGAGNSKGGRLEEVCGESKCAEVLSEKGERRAMLLADWFGQRDIKFDAVYATHKTRTQQTVMPTATANGLPVIQLPAVGSELNPESTTPSECATLEAIDAAREEGLNTILVAGHSGTLYDIMGTGVANCDATFSTGLGLDTGNTVAGTGNMDRFPKKASDGKVLNFGDLWKVVIRKNGNVIFKYRKRLDFFEKLQVIENVN